MGAEDFPVDAVSAGAGWSREHPTPSHPHQRARMTPNPRQQASVGGGEGHLLFEVANGVLICVGEEVKNVVFDMILLQVVHQVSPIALRGRGAGLSRGAQSGENRLDRRTGQPGDPGQGGRRATGRGRGVCRKKVKDTGFLSAYSRPGVVPGTLRTTSQVNP